jgi:tRNA dimethylallyltransferase
LPLHLEILTCTRPGLRFYLATINMKYLITIIGPTAIGKTSLSILLADHYQCEIVSVIVVNFFRNDCRNSGTE